VGWDSTLAGRVHGSTTQNSKRRTQNPKLKTETAVAKPEILETFPNPAPGRDYLIEHTHHEFTSMCPITGHPDFAAITVRYIADKICVELKSLKLYFHAYRNEGIFFEAATNKICDDLGRALQPRALTIIADWKARGGFSSRITAEWKPGRATPGARRARRGK
jgi:7-cyano-7-deazaguanine reductase